MAISPLKVQSLFRKQAILKMRIAHAAMQRAAAAHEEATRYKPRPRAPAWVDDTLAAIQPTESNT